ncbi:MAG: undecaprenyl-diphosphatase UppP [Dehalococcoidia bacterium]
MEDILRAIALGIVQGLTEFLPISSSGHLIIVRELFGWEFTDELTFDVSLHMGTTAAVVAYFARDWIGMARSGLRWLAGDREPRVGEAADARVLSLIIVGSIPIAITGFLLQDWIENEIRSPVVASAMLILFAFVLLLAERLGRGDRSIHDARPKDALAIGGAQAISLIPGISRSGITISAGLVRGLDRSSAARFSFLLSTPAIGGAALLTLGDAISEGVVTDNLDIIIAGFMTSAVVGWLAIAVLMRVLQTHTFLPFIIYRVTAGTFFLLYFTL